MFTKQMVGWVLAVGVTRAICPVAGLPAPVPAWNRDAAYGEAETFDLCNGHQPNDGTYHHHVNPICLRAQLGDNLETVYVGRLGTRYAEKTGGWVHSPILGWALDGNPVYGPYGFDDPNDPNVVGKIRRIKSSFKKRPYADNKRTTLPKWVLPWHGVNTVELATPTAPAATTQGPDVNDQYPAGRYLEDYDYVEGSGDLDQYNGRWTYTPQSTTTKVYAYYVTLNDDGSPAFPYAINAEFYGTRSNATSLPSRELPYYFNKGDLPAYSTNPKLNSWNTAYYGQYARSIDGEDPSAGSSPYWVRNPPPGTYADPQVIQYDASVYVTSNSLPSYTIGPWFDAMETKGVFKNWPKRGDCIGVFPGVAFPSTLPVPATKQPTGLGIVGMWVNGVAIYNPMDGAHYTGIGLTGETNPPATPRAMHVSAASGERGPLAVGSIASAIAEFGAKLASAEATQGGFWGTSLAGTSVKVIDKDGTERQATIGYVSPTLVTYRMPTDVPAGEGTVIIGYSDTFGAHSVSGNVNIVATYPGIYRASVDGLASGTINVTKSETQLTLYGTGLVGSGAGVPPEVYVYHVVSEVRTALKVVASGRLTAIPPGSFVGSALAAAPGTVAASALTAAPGMDYVTVDITSLVGTGRVDLVVTAGDVDSNPVYIVI